MPWKECHVVDERLRFVARLLDGEKMTALCAEFGISRKTGYKIYDRYKDYGVHGLTDRSRRPYRHANQLPLAIETLIVRLKKAYPNWGARRRSARSCVVAVVRCVAPLSVRCTRPRSARTGPASPASMSSRIGYPTDGSQRGECPVVRRLQGSLSWRIASTAIH